MRIFSFLNVLLLLVVMATHEGTHLDGLLSPAQQKWLHEGSKVLMTGQLDNSTVALVLKSAKAEAAKAPMPPSNAVAPTFDFAAESRGGNDSAAVAVPANYSMPPAAPVDVDRALTTVLASLQSS